jgi:hypothetical protein
VNVQGCAAGQGYGDVCEVEIEVVEYFFDWFAGGVTGLGSVAETLSPI